MAAPGECQVDGEPAIGSKNMAMSPLNVELLSKIDLIEEVSSFGEISMNAETFRG